jgi:Tfp pilus assembly protein PilP
VLKGVVKGPDGMLAVVENQQRRSYFLRENDPVFNGQVVRITADSIVFREKVLDKLGHEQTREVVKRISGGRPAV